MLLNQIPISKVKPLSDSYVVGMADTEAVQRLHDTLAKLAPKGDKYMSTSHSYEKINFQLLVTNLSQHCCYSINSTITCVINNIKSSKIILHYSLCNFMLYYDCMNV